MMQDEKPAGDRKKGPSRLSLWLLAGVFVGTFLLSNLLYLYRDSFISGDTVNNGTLIRPPVQLDARIPGAAGSDAARLREKWTVLHLIGDSCDADCLQSLHSSRQGYLTLGDEVQRMQRVLLVSPRLDAQTLQLLRDGHAEGFLRVLESAEFSRYRQRLPRGTDAFYLVDPMGNAMMYYPLQSPAKALHADLKRLLRYSSAG